MDNAGSNTYRFHCEIVEIISTETNSTVKMICNPGSIIVDIPYEKKYKLGDRIIVTGNLEILSTEKDCVSESHYVPNI